MTSRYLIFDLPWIPAASSESMSSILRAKSDATVPSPPPPLEALPPIAAAFLALVDAAAEANEGNAGSSLLAMAALYWGKGGCFLFRIDLSRLG